MSSSHSHCMQHMLPSVNVAVITCTCMYELGKLTVIICFVCYINTVSRLAYRTFYYNVWYSGVSVCLIKIMLLVGWLVGWLVGSLWCSPIVRTTRDFHEIWHRRSASVPNFPIKLWEVKVKVQGQNLVLTSNDLPIIIAGPWFKILSPNLAIRQKWFRQEM